MSDEEKRGPKAVAEVQEPTVQAMVLRDYWVAADEAGRVRAGTVMDVTKDELITGMERGLLARHVG